jgi:hypothetical protein
MTGVLNVAGGAGSAGLAIGSGAVHEIHPASMIGRVVKGTGLTVNCS